MVIFNCCVLWGGAAGKEAKGIYLEVSSANRIVVPSTFYEGFSCSRNLRKVPILWISTNKGDLHVGRQGWSVWVGLRIPLILVKFITHARSRFFVTFPVIPKIISREFINVGIRFLVVLIHHMRNFFNTRVCRSRNDIEEEIVLFNLNALPPV